MPLLQEAVEIAHSISDDELVAFAIRQQGRALARDGDPESGLTLLQQAHALFQQIDAPDEALLTEVLIAEARVLGGDADAALSRATELLALAATSDLEPELRTVRGFALLRLGRIEDAAGDFRWVADSGRPAARSYSYALSCLGLSLAGVPDASSWAERGGSVLRDFGVTAVPLFEAVRS
jgi:tetratricopeptide (TPR) repeat protein